MYNIHVCMYKYGYIHVHYVYAYMDINVGIYYENVTKLIKIKNQ